MAGEYSTHDEVLRQITHHLQAIPLLTASCALDVMGLPAVITITVVGGGAVHGVEVSNVVLWGVFDGLSTYVKRHDIRFCVLLFFQFTS
jgi:hypothetical protein